MEMSLLVPDPHPLLSRKHYKALDWEELVDQKKDGMLRWRKPKLRKRRKI